MSLFVCLFDFVWQDVNWVIRFCLPVEPNEDAHLLITLALAAVQVKNEGGRGGKQ